MHRFVYHVFWSVCRQQNIYDFGGVCSRWVSLFAGVGSVLKFSRPCFVCIYLFGQNIRPRNKGSCNNNNAHLSISPGRASDSRKQRLKRQSRVQYNIHDTADPSPLCRAIAPRPSLTINPDNYYIHRNNQTRTRYTQWRRPSRFCSTLGPPNQPSTSSSNNNNNRRPPPHCPHSILLR
jgi:hypothetical protein